MLSYHFWQQSLSSDPHIVGRSISINGTPFEVVGVMPQGFHGIKQELEPAELWAPISMQTVVLQQPSMLTPHSGLYFLHLFARLSEGATAHKAEFAQSQNWLNQQVRNGIREREGATHSGRSATGDQPRRRPTCSRCARRLTHPQPVRRIAPRS